jgi:hypothetical protein
VVPLVGCEESVREVALSCQPRADHRALLAPRGASASPGEVGRS